MNGVFREGERRGKGRFATVADRIKAAVKTAAIAAAAAPVLEERLAPRRSLNADFASVGVDSVNPREIAPYA